MKELAPADRLIVAADFKPIAPNGREWVREQVLRLAKHLKGTGIYLKVNSALRAIGYDLMDEIHEQELRVFPDLKLFDIGQTLATDGALLKRAQPELLTVVCTTGIAAMQALKAELPDTEVLGVTVLTSLAENDAQNMFHTSVTGAVRRFARLADGVGLDGVICAPTDIRQIRNLIRSSMTINTPAIRPWWSVVPGDDQNPDRIMTPARAIEDGADRIVVGRPITGAADPYDAAMRTLEEIASAIP